MQNVPFETFDDFLNVYKLLKLDKVIDYFNECFYCFLSGVNSDQSYIYEDEDYAIAFGILNNWIEKKINII